jgi:phytoene synthase
MHSQEANARAHERERSVSELVRRQDQDRYWAALLAPPQQRAHLLALYAFNIELGRIAELVREPRLGEIRLQWWREALGDGGSGHPVAEAFAAAREARDMPDAHVAMMIDARSFDLGREPMPGMDALKTYLAATAGAVFALAARIAGAPDGAAAEAAGHGGLAYGLTGLMRALPVHAARGQVFLPADVLGAHGVSPRAITRGEDSAELRAALAALRAEAGAELAAFRKRFASVPAAARVAFLPLALVEPYLNKLAAPGHRPLQEIVEINPLTRLWAMWRAHLRGRI